MIKHLNMIGSISETGYGIATTSILAELVRQGVKVTLEPKGESIAAKKGVIAECIENMKSFRYNAPSLLVWHQFDLKHFIGTGKHTAFPFFELDTFDKNEIHNIKYPDQLFVSSEWAKEVVSQYRQNDVQVIPLGIDPSIFQPAPYKGNGSSYIFLNIGKWEIRKGHDVIPELFNTAFTPEDNVEMWMIPASKYFTEKENTFWTNKYMQTKMGQAGKIKIWPWQTQDNLVRMMNYADCGLFPARAEGWNLELLEMICLGKPVITTDYSAHTEFCNSENALLVPKRKMEKAYDNKWFFGQGNWISIKNKEIDLFVDYMRKCYKENIHTNPYGLETTRTKFTWENTTKKILELL